MDHYGVPAASICRTVPLDRSEQRIVNRVHPNACGTALPVRISIRSKEVSGWMWPPKIGESVQLIPAPSAPRLFERRVFMRVEVSQRYRPEIVRWRPSILALSSAVPRLLATKFRA